MRITHAIAVVATAAAGVLAFTGVASAATPPPSVQITTNTATVLCGGATQSAACKANAPRLSVAVTPGVGKGPATITVTNDGARATVQIGGHNLAGAGAGVTEVAPGATVSATTTDKTQLRFAIVGGYTQVGKVRYAVTQTVTIPANRPAPVQVPVQDTGVNAG